MPVNQGYTFSLLANELAVWSIFHVQLSLAANYISAVHEVLNGCKNLKFCYQPMKLW